MAVPPGKTPISFLQELCTKRGITPQYDLLANEGAVHEPVFIMRATVGDIVNNGKGSSKKKAKHAAAQAALNQILGMPNGQHEQQGQETSSPYTVEDGVPGNPIGELQEFTQKRLLKPPIYDFSAEGNLPHSKEFTCSVKLAKFTEKGTGRSKKTAKRAAAHAILEKIKEITADGDNKLVDSEDEDEFPLSMEQRSSYTALKEGKKKIPVSGPQQQKEIQKFYDNMTKSKKMKNLHKQALNAPSTNYCQMLQEIAEVQRFEVSYMDIPELSVSGQHQCLVQLSTMPVAVCHGLASTVDEAHAQAGHNALQYLKLMTKA